MQTEVSDLGCSGDSELQVVRREICLLKSKIEKRKYCLAIIKSDESKIGFYTGFPNHATLLACYRFLGAAVNCLVYDLNKQLMEGQELFRKMSFYSFSSITPGAYGARSS